MNIDHHSHTQPLGTGTTAYTLQTKRASSVGVQGRIFWSIKYFIVYLGNPILFFLYIIGLGERSIGPFVTFTKLGYNTNRINILLYLSITFPIYIAWLCLQIIVLRRVHSTSFSLDKFLECAASNGSLISSIPGLISLLVFATSGMEGNVFGFLFALPMLLASLSYIILWGDAVFSSCRVREPQKNGGQLPSDEM